MCDRIRGLDLRLWTWTWTRKALVASSSSSSSYCRLHLPDDVRETHQSCPASVWHKRKHHLHTKDKMSANQCKNCGGFTDFNNNSNPYSNGYAMLNPSHHNSHSSSSSSSSSASSMITIGNTQVKAKIMWGTVGAIKELREKEQNRARR